METFKFRLDVEVEVEAFTVEDAEDAVRDCFGPGRMSGIDINSLAVVRSYKH